MAGRERLWQQLTSGMAGGVASLVLGIALIGGMFYLKQPSMVFLPVTTLAATPDQWGLDYEDVVLDAGGGVSLHGWYLPRPGARNVVLFFHGNAGNISHRGDSIRIFHDLGFDVFIVDYRGYGRSTGDPSEEGLYQDARTAWQYLTGQRGFDANQVVVFGRSLGGVVAASLAAEVTPGAVILESTFTSASDMARVAFPLVSRVTVLRYRFPAREFVAQSGAPLLVLHSREDQIVPFELGERLYHEATAPKAFFEMQGGHNGGFLMSQPQYGKALQGFLQSHLATEAI